MQHYKWLKALQQMVDQWKLIFRIRSLKVVIPGSDDAAHLQLKDYLNQLYTLPCDHYDRPIHETDLTAAHSTSRL